MLVLGAHADVGVGAGQLNGVVGRRFAELLDDVANQFLRLPAST
ncbi:hypothetical protein [Hymenobacter sp. YC55]|nr:hypothetical protein [Hymenobacter sp. YC55]MDF7812863.1 hypothetical protein [Hymenobacter sp. YC55]